MKLKIKEAFVIEGDLYKVRNADGDPLHTFGCSVGVETEAGQRLQHNTFWSPGHKHFNEEEYCGDVVLQSRRQAQVFADRVMAVGEIDAAHWSLIPEEPSLEERWASYAEEERRERGY